MRLTYYIISGSNLEQCLRLITRDEEVLYMCEIHAAWPTNRITLYIESGEESLQVVGNECDVAYEGAIGDKGIVGDEGAIGDEDVVCNDGVLGDDGG